VTAAVVVVIILAPGRGVPPDLAADAGARLVRELGPSAMPDAAGALRRLDQRTGTRVRFETERQRARRLRAEYPEDAVVAMRTALQAADEGFLDLTDPGMMTETRVELGQLEMEAGRPDEARRVFAAALAVDPAYRPDPARISPAARQAFADVVPPVCGRADPARARRAAEALGATRLVLLSTCQDGGRVRLRAIDVGLDPGGPRAERDEFVPLGGELRPAQARRLLGAPEPREARPWYRSRWVWVVAGAVVATAVAVPLATADETGDVRVHW